MRKASATATVDVEIHVKNLGATPAFDVMGLSWMTMAKWPLPKSFTFSGPSTGPAATSMIPPGGIAHYHTGTSRPLTTEELAAVERGDLRLYIYGQIRYTDVFGHAHWTNFCHASTSLGKQGFSTAMVKCDQNNDADRD